MSRNQDIKFLHMMTQKPYSVCRAFMKKNNWDLDEAFIDRDVLELIVAATKEVIWVVPKSLVPIVECLQDSSRVLLNQYKLFDESEGHEDD